MRASIVAAALLAGVFARRNQKAADQLRGAKEAYQAAMAKTGDFDCVAPEFDEILKMFDAVPPGTPSRKEARNLARGIREKRAAANEHRSAVDRAAAAPVQVAAAPSAAAPPADCDGPKNRMRALAAARRKAGKPPMGQSSFQSDGEVGYAPGAEPTAEEESLSGVLKDCQ